MAFVFTIIGGTALMCFIILAMRLRGTAGEVKTGKGAHRVALGLAAVATSIMLYKVAVEEVYPCLFVDNKYCDFTSTAYHSSWFPF